MAILTSVHHHLHPYPHQRPLYPHSDKIAEEEPQHVTILMVSAGVAEYTCNGDEEGEVDGEVEVGVEVGGRREGEGAILVPNKHHVLLLLDIQVAMLAEPPIGVPAAQLVRNHLSRILAQARSARPPPLIIHVRNTGDVGEPDEPGAPGWQLMFPPLPGELVIDKLKNNAFAGTNLGEIIPDDAEIVVVGFQTDFCIRATCVAALARGNEVLLIRDAHATYDRIEVLHGGGITPAKKIEAEIETELEDAGVHLLDMKDLPGLFTDR